MAGGLANRIGSELRNALGLPSQNAEIMAGNMIRLARSQPGEETFVRAASLFGKFDRAFLLDLRQTILASREDSAPPASALGQRPGPPDPAAADPSVDRLEPARPLRAGLQSLGGDVRLLLWLVTE